jgi:hypothetical protein
MPILTLSLTFFDEVNIAIGGVILFCLENAGIGVDGGSFQFHCD